MVKTSVARTAGILRGCVSITRNTILAILGAISLLAAAPAANAMIAASILMDEASGRVLRGYRAEAPHPPASLAKMMTLYLAFEALEQGKITLGTRVPISYHAAAQAPSKLYLQPGMEVTVEQLILAAAVKSANDAAAALGEFLAGGSEHAFAESMTAKARELGMRSTTFRNASGLPASGAYTTAYDMAVLARALHARFPRYSHYFARRYFQWGARTFRNTNRLLHTRGDVTGMKTGYTRASGFNLVVTATHGQQKVISVVLGGRTSGRRYQAASALLGTSYRLPPAQNATVAARDDDDDDDDGDERPAASPAKKPGFSLISRAHAATRAGAPETSRAIKRFGVQIGAYRSYGQAQNAAQKAYYGVPGAYRNGSTRIAVVAVKHGRKKQYAARVLGFNQSAAHQTCRALMKRGLRCQTVSYSLQSASLHSVSDIGDDDDRPAYKPKKTAKTALAKKRIKKRHSARYRR
jgi:D-alanyl-D-alanine carboxypeptidase